MAIGGVVIQFRADADQAQRSILGLAKGVKKVGDEAERSNGASSKLGDVFSGMIKSGPAALAVGFGALAFSMVGFAKAAIEDNLEAGKLAKTLSGIPSVTQAMIEANSGWIDSMELATNISDTEFRASIGKLASVTGSLAEAQQLSALAADVAVGRNISLEAATKLVSGAVTGHTAQLEKQFPWLDKNKDGTISLAEATKGLGDRYKGAAKEAANQDVWASLQTIWGQLKESLGQFILPLLKRFGDWFKEPANQAKVKQFIDKVADLSEQIGVKAVEAIEKFLLWLQDPRVQAAFTEWKNAFKDLKAFIDDAVDAYGLLKQAFQYTPIGQMMKQLGALADAAWKAYKWLKKAAGQPVADTGPDVTGGWTGNPSFGNRPRSAERSQSVVINVSGALDPVAVASQIDRMMSARSWRTGTYAALAL